MSPPSNPPPLSTTSMNPNLLPQNVVNPSESALNTYGNRNTMYQNCNIQNTQNDPPDPRRSGIEILADHIAPTALHSSNARNARTACLEGTRVGIVDKLTTWVEDPSKKHRVCWVTGGAGVGKSAIAQTICETFRRKSQLAASFFFSRNDASRSTLDRFFPTLAHQLATAPEFQTAGLSSFIDGAVRQTPNVLQGTNLEGQFQLLVSRPCAQIDAKRWKTLPKLIVIDGYDECMGGPGTTSASHAQETLLSIINHATSASPPIPFQFMIFSRPEHTIRNFFRTSLSHEPVDTRDFNEEANRDIRVYLEKEFATLSDSRPEILAMGVWPGEEATSQLVHKSDGHFIYVVTAMKYITSNNPLPADLRERLDIILHTEETASHPDLSDLDQLYHTILRRFGNGDLHTQLLLPLLQLVITPVTEHLKHLSQRRPHLLAALLKIDFQQCSGLLSQLRSVLHIPDDPHNEGISVLHASFLDFLGDGHRSHEFQVQPLQYSPCLDRICCSVLLILGQQLHQHQRQEQMESKNQRLELSSLASWYTIDQYFLSATKNRPGIEDDHTPSEELLSAVVNFNLYAYSNMILDRFVLVPLELFDIGITYTPSKWAKETFRGCQSMNWKEYLFPRNDYDGELQYHKHRIGPAAKHREFFHALFRTLLKNMFYIQELYTKLKHDGMDLHHSYFEDDWLAILPKDKKNKKVSLSRLGCIAALGLLPRPTSLPVQPGLFLEVFPRTARDSWSIASPLNVLPHAELERATTKFSGDKFEFCLVGRQQRGQFAEELAKFAPTYEGVGKWKYPPAISTAVWDSLLKTLTSTTIKIPQPNGESDSKEVAAPRWLRGLRRIFS
ncbi:hypothetical protein AAF712_014367 [Marasmius tenuissimus]|uniref:Nephrocystin 3-like N-terminal domain-containing protein n=1 Tax=Marasmius tenuissimus TaxID=585030 RepID=A0ABR2ZCI0_9AGAR